MKIESPVLLRLGPVPFWRGTKKCLPELDLVYRRARTAAGRMLEGGCVEVKNREGFSPGKVESVKKRRVAYV